MEAVLRDYCKQLKLKTLSEVYEDVPYESKEQYLTELLACEVASPTGYSRGTVAEEGRIPQHQDAGRLSVGAHHLALRCEQGSDTGLVVPGSSGECIDAGYRGYWEDPFGVRVRRAGVYRSQGSALLPCGGPGQHLVREASSGNAGAFSARTAQVCLTEPGRSGVCSVSPMFRFTRMVRSFCSMWWPTVMNSGVWW